MTGENVTPHPGDTALEILATSKLGTAYQNEIGYVRELIAALRHEVLQLETTIRDLRDATVTEDELRGFLAEQGVLTITEEDLAGLTLPVEAPGEVVPEPEPVPGGEVVAVIEGDALRLAKPDEGAAQ